MSAQRDNLLKQCPCSREKWAKCGHAWHLALQHAGRRYSISLDKYAKRRGLALARLRGDAEILAARITGEIETSTYQDEPTCAAGRPATAGVSGSPAGLTFDQAWPKFVEADFEDEVVTVAEEQRRLRLMADVRLDGVRIGDRLLAALTEDQVETLYRTITKQRSNSTKKKYRGILKRFLDWCVAKKHLVTSPITPATTLRAGKPVMRRRRVHRDEEANLLEAAAEGRNDAAWRLVAIIIAALELGARLGELLALQWSDVLWDFGRVSIRAVEPGARKTKDPRQVLLTPRLEEALRTLWAAAPTSQGWRKSDYIFGDATGARVQSIRKAWMTAVLRAHNILPAWTGTALAPSALAAFKAIDLHFHDLRHECALRWHQEKRYSLGTIAILLGHADLSTLRVYLGIEKEDALAEATRINAELAAAGPHCSKPAVNQATARILVHRRKGVAKRQAAVGE